MSGLTVAELVGRALAKLGARHCFGVVGSGNFAVTNALRDAGVEFTATRHEGGAATMADAYARMSDTVALVSLHQGCGLTNAVTGIGEAAKSRTPVVVLAAESAPAPVPTNFSIDQSGLASAVLASPQRVNSPASALGDVVHAFRLARDERRTVVLNLPIIVQDALVPEASIRALETLTSPPRPAPPRASDASVRALADLIRQAERPVIVAGRGARGAGRELRELGRVAGALLATSAVANGLFEGEAFSLGISGGFSSPLSAELISQADLIVSFGCALNMWTMRHGRLIGDDTRVAQVDLEPLALGAQRPIDLGVVGDAALTARAVADELARSGAGERYRTAEVAEAIAAEARWNDVPHGEPGLTDVHVPGDLSVIGDDGERRIDPRILTDALDRILPAERVVSIDSGNFMGYPSSYLRVPDEYGFCFTQAFQSIGLGLATAIGAALAQPERLPVLGVGDGGFLMAIAELETAVRLELPLVVIVYNDDAYGAEVHHFGADGVPPDFGTVTFPRVDIASIARGFGAAGVTVRSVDDLEPVRAWLEAGDGPIVIDARIASDGGAWWLAEAFGH
ncbi:thiamine pyrophosphate-binding protein [Gulosibacter sp. ACHW.36C]|uniref:Thiamine pyrophosphate-binding protein n=1 Tax=Gulosibacter sediminis TaxID=1729695 RepID=A0ABY4MUV6_9MICO|nr:thiamine pyrophosphate-binding protein [Gulosibacter sediminis]UQN14169.1 thiamine pyrophosphate-binding protein [Gulosibacter sediminis]